MPVLTNGRILWASLYFPRDRDWWTPTVLWWNPTTTSFYLFIGETYAKGHIFSQPRHITKSKLVGCLNKGFFKQEICRNCIFSFITDIERMQQSKEDSAWRGGHHPAICFISWENGNLLSWNVRGPSFIRRFLPRIPFICYQHFVRACLFWIVSSYCVLMMF